VINNRTHPHITAKIIADSIGIGNDPQQIVIAPRLTTFELTYPRYIHAEVMTNRAISKNAQSSRAIPVKRRLERVRGNPVKPIFWGANQKGMQSKIEEADALACNEIWEYSSGIAAGCAEDLMNQGLHKQWANRLLEPFDTITIIATATNWGNMFALRCHEAAMPEYQDLAWKMADLYFNNDPMPLRKGDWHLPYITDDDRRLGLFHMPPPESERESPFCDAPSKLQQLIKCSVARCARVSYLNHDGSEPDIEKDLALHDRLLADGHMSPFENQAQVVTHLGTTHSGNFAQGWLQYRKTLEGECRTFDRADYERERAKQCPDRPLYTGE
jgi:thymidylate synthase ThyX